MSAKEAVETVYANEFHSTINRIEYKARNEAATALVETGWKNAKVFIFRIRDFYPRGTFDGKGRRHKIETNLLQMLKKLDSKNGRRGQAETDSRSPREKAQSAINHYIEGQIATLDEWETRIPRLQPDFSQPIRPEKIDLRLTLEGLTTFESDLFLFPYKPTEYYSRHLSEIKAMAYKQVAVVSIGDRPRSLLVVDLESGRSKELRPKLSKKTHPQELSQEFVDEPSHQKTKAARDYGQKKHEGQTSELFEQMVEADRQARVQLHRKDLPMDSLIESMASIRRIARMRGRDWVKRQLVEIRKTGNIKGSDLVRECATEIWFYKRAGYYNKTESLNRQTLIKTIGAVLATEKVFLQPVSNIPWNTIGPEPFDTLIDVLWFRYDYLDLRPSLILGDYIKAIERKYWRQAGAARKRAGSESKVSDYVDFSSMRSDIDKLIEGDKFCGLTKLLWSTLKWAGPSQWKTKETVSLFRRDSPYPEDELIRDPKWDDSSDFQGRLVLEGEWFHIPLSHVQRELENEGRHLSELEMLGILAQGKMHFDDVWDLLLELHRNRLPNKKPEIEDIVNHFNDTIKNLSFATLTKILSKMDKRDRDIVLNRLGYSIKISKDWNSDRVGSVVSSWFDKKPSRYYSNLKKITKQIAKR